jgi:modification methylase
MKELNKIICGDAIEVMRKMPDESVDLIVTSPPYNLFDKSEGKRWGGGFMSRNRKLKNAYHLYADNIPRAEYIKWQRECLTEMMRLIPDTGAIFYNHKWRVSGGLQQDQTPIVKGFPVRQTIIWHRTGGVNFNDHYFLPNYEVIYMIAKPDFRLRPEANRIGCVWRIHQETKNEHPAPFPVEVPRRIIDSTHAAVILDPFMGRGTTAVAAKQLKRQYIGIDLSPEYCRMAEARLHGTPIEQGTHPLLAKGAER